MDKVYNLAYTITYIKHLNRIYNWLNGEYVEFDDLKHPYLFIVKNNIKNFSKFKYENSFNDFEWLLEKKFIVESQNEIFNIIKNRVKENNSNKYLQLTLLPAQMACNFNCSYCYEDRNQKAKMIDEHQKILMKYIKNNKNLKSIYIAWFGGEPLLNKEFILNYSKELQQYCELNQIEYKATMTTNAYFLTKKLFLKCLDLGIKSYQITLDGIEKEHDKLRFLANGDPTFNVIIQNLLDIATIINRNYSITIRVNYNESFNIEKFIQYMRKIKLATHKNFSYIFRPIQTDWNESKNEVFCKTNQNILQENYENIALASGLKKGDFLLFNDIGSTSCYASRENSLIIYPDLSVRKCSVALDFEKNIVGRINKDGFLEKNQNWNLWLLNSKSIHNKNECLTCSFNPQCLSSYCPLLYIKKFEIVCPTVSNNLEENANKIIEYIEKLT